MKIKLSFDSLDEFAVFILSASSINFDLMFQRMNTDLPVKEFLANVNIIQVEDVTYSVKSNNSLESKLDVDCSVINYMLNKAQIENGSVLVSFSNEDETIVGSQKVREYFNKNLPDTFLLRVGWRTEYTEFTFCKKVD